SRYGDPDGEYQLRSGAGRAWHYQAARPVVRGLGQAGHADVSSRLSVAPAAAQARGMGGSVGDSGKVEGGHIMSRIDESRDFIPVRIAILTVSDTRQAGDDRSGDALAERIGAAGHRVVARTILRDERATIAAQLRAWCGDDAIDVIISTGGTGLTGRDVT